MRRCHAISPGFTGHYRDLGISNRKMHDSACNIILSVVNEIRCPGTPVNRVFEMAYLFISLSLAGTHPGMGRLRRVHSMLAAGLGRPPQAPCLQKPGIRECGETAIIGFKVQLSFSLYSVREHCVFKDASLW